MQAPVYLERKDVPDTILRHYPSGKSLKLRVAEEITIHASDGLWSDGYRTRWQAVSLADGRLLQLSDDMSAPWDASRQSRTIQTRDGIAFLEFHDAPSCRGPALTLTIHVHPDNAAKMLPPTPSELLEPADETVLKIIRGIKSGYRENEYRRANLSGSTVLAVKAKLTRLGYLNPAGALTTAGKNVAATLRGY